MRGAGAAAAGRFAWTCGLVGMGLLACGGGRIAPTPDSGMAPSVLDESRSSVVVIGATRLAANGVAETRVKVALLDTLGQPMSGVRVDVEASGAGPAFSASGITSPTGIFTAALSSRVAGVETVSATAHVSTGLTPLFEHPTVEFTPGPAAQLVFAPRPERLQAGLGLQVVVEVADAQGNVVPSATPAISVKLSRAPTGVVLLGTPTRTAVGGVARFDDLTLITVGTGYVLTATAEGFDSVQSQPFQVIAGPPDPAASKLEVTQAFSTADGVETQALSLQLEDLFGNPCVEIPVTLSAADPAVRFDASLSDRTDANGNFRAEVRSTLAGHLAISATAEGLTLSATTPFYAGPMDLSKSTFTLTSTPVVADGVAAATMQAHLADAFGNPTLSRLELTLLDPTGAVFQRVDIFADQSGSCETSFTSMRAGHYTLEAKRFGASGPPLFTGAIDFVAGPAVRLEFQEAPERLYANEKTSFAVAVVDARGNVVQDRAPVSVTVSLRSSDARPALEGTLTRMTVDGVARFGDIRVDHSAKWLRLDAAAGALRGESGAFDVRPFQPVGPVGGDVSAVLDESSLGLYAGTHGGGLFESTDGGQSFFSVDLGVGALDVTSLVQVSGSLLVATTANGGVFWSMPGSDLWQSWNAGLPDLTARSFAWAPGLNAFVLGTDEGVFTSPSAGAKWSPLGGAPADSDVRAVFGATGPLAATGSGRLFQYSANGWIDVGLDLGGAATRFTMGLNGHLYATSRGGGLFESIDFGVHWERVEGLDSTEVNGVSAPGPGVLFAATADESLMTSTNDGRTWTRLSPLLPTRVNTVTSWPGNWAKHLVGTARGLFRIDGSDADPVEADLRASDVHALVFDPAKTGALYAATDQGVFHLDERGEQWQARVGDLPRTVFVSVQVDPTRPQALWAASADGRVFASTDSGAQWTERSTGLGASDLVTLVMDRAIPRRCMR